ncbi:Zonadhesin-like protein, partial [Leptotrombidium deliense]
MRELKLGSLLFSFSLLFILSDAQLDPERFTFNPSDCTPDEEFVRCGSVCHPTCESIFKSEDSLICTKQCVIGCFCRRGLLRDKSGKCIPREACPPPNAASRADELTQEKVDVIRDPFPDQAPSRQPDGRSSFQSPIKPERPTFNPTTCRADEEYKHCGSVCDDTCTTVVARELRPCTLQCVSGCFCKPPLVRDLGEACVPASQCANASNAFSPQGAPDSPYDRSGRTDSRKFPPNVSDRTDARRPDSRYPQYPSQPDVRSSGRYPPQPQEGVFGQRFRPQTPDSTDGRDGRQFYPRPDGRDGRTFQTQPSDGKVNQFRPQQPDGRYPTTNQQPEGRDGRQLQPRPDGRDGRQFPSQQPEGREGRSNSPDSSEQIKPGRNAANARDCRRDENFQTCGSACDDSCANINDRGTRACTYQCVIGCFCNKPLVRAVDGSCIRPENCPIIQNGTRPDSRSQYPQQAYPQYPQNPQYPLYPQYPQSPQYPQYPQGPQQGSSGSAQYPNQQYPQRPQQSSQPRNPQSPDQQYPGQTKEQFPKYPTNFTQNPSGPYQPPQQSPFETQCGQNEIFLNCGTSCEDTCETIFDTRPRACTYQCVMGCFCTQGLVRDRNGNCVSRNQCSPPLQSGTKGASTVPRDAVIHSPSISVSPNAANTAIES